MRLLRYNGLTLTRTGPHTLRSGLEVVLIAPLSIVLERHTLPIVWVVVPAGETVVAWKIVWVNNVFLFYLGFCAFTNYGL